eukprot:7727737-Alexandrium_andersonii.AAC.1
MLVVINKGLGGKSVDDSDRYHDIVGEHTKENARLNLRQHLGQRGDQEGYSHRGEGAALGQGAGAKTGKADAGGESTDNPDRLK